MGTCSRPEQAALLTELGRIKQLPEGRKTWLNAWINREANTIFETIHEHSFHTYAKGMDLGHPVTWPKEREDGEVGVIFNMQPKDTTFYVWRLAMPVPCEQPPFWYQSEDVSPYFLTWFLSQPSFLTKRKVVKGDEALAEMLMHAHYFTRGTFRERVKEEEILRQAEKLCTALQRRFNVAHSS